MSYPITYLEGDATYPLSDGRIALICHICNDEGGWGKGFVLALSKRDRNPEVEYRNAFCFDRVLSLGQIQVVPYVDMNTAVVNMVAQRGYRHIGGKPPIRYLALENCFVKLMKKVTDESHTVAFHMPRIGTGLAGGDWTVIEQIINNTICKLAPVYVYDLPKSNDFQQFHRNRFTKVS